MPRLNLGGPWLFYFDFAAFPAIGVGLFAAYCRSWEFAGQALLGVLLFTFLEYWAHRTVLHRFFFHGPHERHHDHPAEYVVFPIWYTPAAFAGFFLILPLPVFAGMVVGFCWFIYWHHVLHHFDLTSWPRPIQRYALWHLAHHRDEAVNFGITVSLWDIVFRTYRKV
jgi:sterol desaturase/sphingolipid hydroxylase (fatty acid hydroxylase superfamily)